MAHYFVVSVTLWRCNDNTVINAVLSLIIYQYFDTGHQFSHVSANCHCHLWCCGIVVP